MQQNQIDGKNEKNIPFLIVYQTFVTHAEMDYYVEGGKKERW